LRDLNPKIIPIGIEHDEHEAVARLNIENYFSKFATQTSKEGQTSTTRANRQAPAQRIVLCMNANQRELTNAVEAKDPPFVPSAVKEIIVAIGLSPHSEATARYAAKWAELFGASINLVHVRPLESSDGFGMRQELITALRLRRESPQEALSVLAKDIQESCPKSQMTVLEGEPVEKVASLARSLNADLIVIGSHHQTGFLGRLFAPDNERNLIHRAPCSVLVYQESCYKGEVASADDSWRKPLPVERIYLPH
jgi:nucleotide-binding universal stress UspA family protein